MNALVINTKNPCNTYDFVTNKGLKPPEIQIPLDRIAIKYADIGIIVLKPSIDRLKFGFRPDEKLLAKIKAIFTLDEWLKAIKTSLAQDGFYTGDTGLSYITGVSFKKPPYSLYNVNLSFKPCETSEPIIIQVDPKKGGYAFMRFDMNPNRITKKGMKRFWELIDDILVTPDGNISREDFLIWSKINSVEIAVDILGIRPNEIEVKPMSNGKPVKKKSHVYKSATGRTETIYPKAVMFKTTTEYLYDKRQEQIDRKMPPIYGDFLHTRYESRVQNTMFFKLHKVTNRCRRVSVRALDYNKLWTMDYVRHLFIRHALYRTPDKALELIPDELKPEFKTCYDDAMQNIWNHKKIWSYWKETVTNSGLLPPQQTK